MHTRDFFPLFMKIGVPPKERGPDPLPCESSGAAERLIPQGVDI